MLTHQQFDIGTPLLTTIFLIKNNQPKTLLLVYHTMLKAFEQLKFMLKCVRMWRQQAVTGEKKLVAVL